MRETIDDFKFIMTLIFVTICGTCLTALAS